MSRLVAIISLGHLVIVRFSRQLPSTVRLAWMMARVVKNLSDRGRAGWAACQWKAVLQAVIRPAYSLRKIVSQLVRACKPEWPSVPLANHEWQFPRRFNDPVQVVAESLTK